MGKGKITNKNDLLMLQVEIVLKTINDGKVKLHLFVTQFILNRIATAVIVICSPKGDLELLRLSLRSGRKLRSWWNFFFHPTVQPFLSTKRTHRFDTTFFKT